MSVKGGPEHAWILLICKRAGLVLYIARGISYLMNEFAFVCSTLEHISAAVPPLVQLVAWCSWLLWPYLLICFHLDMLFPGMSLCCDMAGSIFWLVSRMRHRAG